MSDTGNKPQVEKVNGQTGSPGFQPGLSPWGSLVTQTPSTGGSAGEQIDPRALYRVSVDDPGQTSIELPLVLASQKYAQAWQDFEDALNSTDQIERENCISVGWSNIAEIMPLVGVSTNFDDAFTLLLNAFAVHSKSPYGVPEIEALLKVLRILRFGAAPPQDQIEFMYNELERAGFDLNAHFADVDFEGEESE